MNSKDIRIKMLAGAAGCIVIFGMLFVGIRKDFLMLETVALGGAGLILLLIGKPAWLIYLQILYCCINKFLISQFSMPDAINYATDVLMLLGFALALKVFCEKRRRHYFAAALAIASVFFICGTLSAVFQQVDLLLILWSYRNLMRFFIFFFTCAVLLEYEDVRNLLKLFTAVFTANILVVSFQFWIQGYSQDNLGGLFGTQMGCNGYMNTFLCIYLSYICIFYMARKLSFPFFLYASAGSLYIAALSELKFWFVEFVLILGVSVLVSRFTARTVFMVLGAFVGLYIGLQLFNRIFPGWEFSIDQIVDYAGRGGYSTENDLNRLTALGRIGREFLYDIRNLFFGFGLGSCETSSFFDSIFFQEYGETLHYTYLLHAFLFLETGIVGLVSYLGFYICIFINGLCFRLKMAGEEKLYCSAAALTALTCIGQTIYNNALRVENSGYLAFFMLAVPFICMKKAGEKQDESGEKSQCHCTGL